jgi:hypothetical protein
VALIVPEFETIDALGRKWRGWGGAGRRRVKVGVGGPAEPASSVTID